MPPPAERRKKAPRWDLTGTEGCGGGIRFLAPYLVVWGYIGIYRRKKYVGGATWGPQGWRATVGVLGTGVPRLACLRPTAWLCKRARTTHLHQQAFKTHARGQASRGGRHKTSSGAASPGWLARGGEIKARQTSRGSRDVSHDNRDQAGASTRSVLVSSLVLRRQAQARSTKASSKGFHIGATRPRPAGRHDGGHRRA